MKRKIPSTVALSVFEAAARHESFARAAAELHLTESAVSRQIATLEGYLGVKLFSREKKQVALTDAGLRYAVAIRPNLDEVEAQTLALMSSKSGGGVLELAVIPTFAARWLVPRLPEFQRSFPRITVNIAERADPLTFRGTPFDMALHFDHISWEGVHKIHLFDEEVVPVLSPQHFDVKELQQARNFMQVPLLVKRSRPEGWQQWFELAGCKDAAPLPAIRFELYSTMIEAAKAGLGVGLIPRFYVHDDVQRGALAMPLDLAIKHEKRYCLLYPTHRVISPVAETFRDWIVAQAQDFLNDRESHQ
ncbi:LysR substrate-binding domain-containing protein [Hydrogenophaga sp. ZJX-1]|uniref:LysR substrate-binding domain-containing protein n=1 Tax=Hydrogenophaga sp. ZJX-1 TaxID=3404778 RepID=UPI003B28DC91